MKIEEQITLYPELSGEERAAVEHYVDEHPEWKPALAEARRWDDLLSGARALGREPSGDEALAYYVVMRRLQREQAPEEVADLIRQIEERIESDPALSARIAEMESRLHAADNASSASEQFERLTKRARGGRDRTKGPRSPVAKPLDHSRLRSANNGATVRRSHAASHGRRVLATVLVAVAVYGVLYAAGQLARAPHERLAGFQEEELMLEGFENVRGGESEDAPNSAAVAYLDALEQLRGAETSFIGLFPGFDDARLDSAAVLLNEVISSEPAESFLAGEAAFLLGKTELARGNRDAASQAFGRVLVTGGRRAPEARRILVELGS